MLLPYALVLRISSFLYESKLPDYVGGVFFEFIESFISSSFWSKCIALLLLFVEAWILNIITNRNRLSRLQNSLPGMLFVLLASASPHFHYFNPVFLSTLFVLLGIKELYKIYKKPLSALFIFNAGFLFALAVLCYSPWIVLVIYGLLGILILNAIDFKRILQFLIGFFLPFYLTYTVCLNVGQSDLFFELLPKWSLNIPQGFTLEDYIYLGTTLFFLLVVVFSYNLYMIKKSIQAQQKIDMFFWLMILCFIGMFSVGDYWYYQISILALPIGFLLHMNLLKYKTNFIPGLIHFVLLTTILGYQFSVHLL